MAPQQKPNRIMTLNDITSRRTAGNDESQHLNEPDNSSVQKNDRWKTNIPGTNGYCQPANSDENNRVIKDIPLHIIPDLPKSDVCEQTLKRIHEEFVPIIRRRGYNVVSISELCCCGDGADCTKTESGRRRRKSRKMENNVLGYNQTSFSGRYGGKSHAIHLRLRHPDDHSIIFPWEDVAGTMAHELSHCIHQNHGEGFYKLMEEILEEHATLQVYGPSGPSFLRPTNAHIVQRNRDAGNNGASVPMPDSGGQRLGGNNNTGKSQLLEPSNARKLGGSSTSRASSPKELRERAARAAETRQRQLQQVRRMVEKAKEPCVIELLDDDDEEEQGGVAKKPSATSSNEQALDSKPSAKQQSAAYVDLVGEKIVRDGKIKNKKGDKKGIAAASIIVLDEDKKVPAKESVVSSKNRKMDGLFSQQNKGRNDSKPVIDLTGDDLPAGAIASAQMSWDCGRCTYKNRGAFVTCEICLSHR